MTEHRELTEEEIEQIAAIHHGNPLLTMGAISEILNKKKIIDDLNEEDSYEYWEFTVAGDDGYNQNGIKNQYLISPDKMIRLNRTVYEDSSPSVYSEDVSKWENE